MCQGNAVKINSGSSRQIQTTQVCVAKQSIVCYYSILSIRIIILFEGKFCQMCLINHKKDTGIKGLIVRWSDFCQLDAEIGGVSAFNYFYPP